MARANGNTELASQDIMDRPITFRPFMGNADIVLTANSVLRLIAKPTRSGKMPTPEQAIRFAKLCEARGLNPWEGDAYLVGYDGKDGAEFNLITAHQAFLKRAEVHPEFDGMESGVVVADPNGVLTDQPGDFVANEQTLAGGWARVHFKTRKIPTYRRINLSTFNTNRSRWEKDPGGMIVKCAEADALRSSFPTKLGGLYLREEFDLQIENETRPSVQMPRALPKPTPPAPLPDTQLSPDEANAYIEQRNASAPDTEQAAPSEPVSAGPTSVPPSDAAPPADAEKTWPEQLPDIAHLRTDWIDDVIPYFKGSRTPNQARKSFHALDVLPWAKLTPERRQEKYHRLIGGTIWT